ncbi:Serine/threonine-protein kinase Sgk1 [Cichlidogyrus casuarinus]|uniref:Serine/threonine-protein kinase Sgk1 n=1 Tax=Cichlidogyrus casuarinus TaxID=1844966 RepID=A0ABD2Q9Q4_9PLAT
MQQRLTTPLYRAQTGRLRGNPTLPVDKTGIDAFQVSRVHPHNVTAFFKIKSAVCTEAKSEGKSVYNLAGTENKNACQDSFEFLKLIGTGNFGKVYLAKNKFDNKVFAVKVLNKSKIRDPSRVLVERNVLVQTLKHPFLCQLHYTFQSNTKLFFVIDYVNGGELFYHLSNEKRFNETKTRFYISEIACALGYLHSQNIIYRDLKTENVLLDSIGHIVLTDFGLCKQNFDSKDTTSTFCGSPEVRVINNYSIVGVFYTAPVQVSWSREKRSLKPQVSVSASLDQDTWTGAAYLAPEVLRKESYDRTVDWWCVGIVTYEMLTGLPPFYSEDHQKMYQSILYDNLNLPDYISSPAAMLIVGLLVKDAKLRLGSVDDLEEIKAQDFFASINFKKLEAREIQPPFKPNSNSELDTQNISEEFTEMPISQSVVQSYKRTQVLDPSYKKKNDNRFDGFTFVQGNILNTD